MVYFHRVVITFLFFALLISCAEKKEAGKVIVTEQEFSIRQDGEFNTGD
ncbi:MAG: hypothetical protein R2875_11055 [Desulfobacterales bacterium]